MNKLCIIHTTPTTIISLKPLVNEILGGIAICNFLDDSILPEINGTGYITDGVRMRVENMLRSAASVAPDAILFACSTIGELTVLAEPLTCIPVCRIDEPMCAEAVEKGVTIAVAATLDSTLAPTCGLIEAIASAQGKAITLIKRRIDGANAALHDGRGEVYDEMVSAALKELKAQADIVVLAQASMARALAKIETDKELYLTSPASGLEALRCL